MGNCLFCVLAASQDGSSEDNDAKPEVVADISPGAVEDSVSFDGARVLGGILLGSSEQSNSIEASDVVTKNSSTSLGISLGAEYAKSFKKIKSIKELSCSIGVMLDISPQKKQEGHWSELNEAYNNINNQIVGNRTGILKTGAFVPSIMLKLAYRIPSIESAVFVKLLLSHITVRQEYYFNAVKMVDINISTFSPSIALGIEYKINAKLGISLEYGLSFKRTAKKIVDQVTHCVSLKKSGARLLINYRLSQS
jgi:hypothetical protein